MTKNDVKKIKSIISLLRRSDRYFYEARIADRDSRTEQTLAVLKYTEGENDALKEVLQILLDCSYNNLYEVMQNIENE